MSRERYILIGTGVTRDQVVDALAEIEEPDDVLVSVFPTPLYKDRLSFTVVLDQEGAAAYEPIVVEHLAERLGVEVRIEQDVVDELETDTTVTGA